MPAPLVAFGIWHAVTWIIGIATAGYVAKKGLDKFGENKQNQLAQQGISPERQYQDYMDYHQDRKKYIEEKTDEHLKEVNDRNKDLQEENKSLSQKLESTSEPQEKAQIMAAIQANKKEIAQNNREKAEFINKLHKQYEGFVKGLTQEQFQAKAQQPNLASWKNWGIIILCVFLGFMLISFLKKMFDKLTRATD